MWDQTDSPVMPDRGRHQKPPGLPSGGRGGGVEAGDCASLLILCAMPAGGPWAPGRTDQTGHACAGKGFGRQNAGSWSREGSLNNALWGQARSYGLKGTPDRTQRPSCFGLDLSGWAVLDSQG